MPAVRGARWAALLALLLAGAPIDAGRPAEAGGPTGGQEPCPEISRLQVPGAERQQAACLADLTTAGTTRTGHTDQTDWMGLHARGTRNPSGVPGIQVDGYFPDTSTFNSYRGWFHDAQFVLRLPDRWNGKLVVTGAPGVRRQYANDFIISDWVLSRGYAYASTDKGNSGTSFYRDGVRPGDAVAEWHQRVTELTLAAKQVVAQRYGKPPGRTYLTGISNGGYLTRWFLWADHYTVYWDLTQRIFREEFDPEYDGALQAGIPFCPSGTPSCDADYVYADRPAEVKAAVGRVSLTGAIGRPMLTLHGTLDALLPVRTDSDVYAGMVTGQGRAGLHRYYVVQDGNHVDGRYDDYSDRLRPILPCYRAAFVGLERWVEQGQAPTPSGRVPRPATGDVVNQCSLPGSPDEDQPDRGPRDEGQPGVGRSPLGP
ncbi:MAG: tannase/feruloyl esterase family alpha/beta hydrolase [Actinomycetota bacterium]